ncbi:MAG: hypothetical protein ABI091_02355 [Ferruginibacter sp.]
MMKMQIKKMMLGLVLIMSLSLVAFSASAKFWGWQTASTTDWADGHCAYRKTCEVHYILWISGPEKCNTEIIGCID